MYTSLVALVRPLCAARHYTTRLRDRDVTVESTPRTTSTTNASAPSLHNFFHRSDAVLNKRKFNRERGQLHFIFLEGLPGTGKQGVLWRLNKVSGGCILKLLLCHLPVLTE